MRGAGAGAEAKGWKTRGKGARQERERSASKTKTKSKSRGGGGRTGVEAEPPAVNLAHAVSSAAAPPRVLGGQHSDGQETGGAGGVQPAAAAHLLDDHEATHGPRHRADG